MEGNWWKRGMLRDWRQVSLERTDQKANWKKRRKHAFITGEMVQLGCILITHFAENLTKLPMFSLESFVSQKICYYKFFFFSFFNWISRKSLIGNECVRQERNANHGPCRNDEIVRSVSCYKCVVTDLNLAQGCIICSIESCHFIFYRNTVTLLSHARNFHKTDIVRLSLMCYRW